MHKLQDKKAKLIIYKTLKRFRVQQLAYLVTWIRKKYIELIKSNVKYLTYKAYSYVKHGSVKK